MTKSIIQGFSKLTKQEKLRVIEKETGLKGLSGEFSSFLHPDFQDVFDNISENVLTNYYLPYSIAPNFLINDKIYHIPMVTEESSVVAAASSAARFWALNGGFKARVISSVKTGMIYFKWSGDKELIYDLFPEMKGFLLAETSHITENMVKRGGGIVEIELIDFADETPGFFRIEVSFETVDSMGANFINSALEEMASLLKSYLSDKHSSKGECEILMAILSNYTPECFVECRLEAPISRFDKIDGEISGSSFIEKFITAVEIAEIDIYRAVTHNKGIMNGIDAVVLATGNDFRAIEADVHAYASRNGTYSSLSEAYTDNGIFHFLVTLPITVGTVGGLTSLHPLAKKSLEILGNPNAHELMMIIASAGLANHFSAIKALVTKGIQKGHMKMHLGNILMQLGASPYQKNKAIEWFADKKITVANVRDFLIKNPEPKN